MGLLFHIANFSADADVRLARRIRRDTVEKGRDIGAVLDQVRNFYLCTQLFQLRLDVKKDGFWNYSWYATTIGLKKQSVCHGWCLSLPLFKLVGRMA